MTMSQGSTLPPVSTLFRNNSASSGSSSSPPASPRTPRSVDAPTSYFDMQVKRERSGAPQPLASLPSLAASVPLIRKVSDERRSINSLLNDKSARRPEHDQPPPPAHSASAPPPPHHPPPGYPYPSPSEHPHSPYYPPHYPHGPPAEHHVSHNHQMAYRPLYPPGHNAPQGPMPPGPLPARGQTPPPQRRSFEYRPPASAHPAYGRPDMNGRRHTYHPAMYEYPYYEGVPVAYAPMMGMPLDPGGGARQPISRTTKACDGCRARKVRCDAGGHPGSTGPCSRCRESGRVCHYTASHKKRGPCPGRPSRAQSNNSATPARRSSLSSAQQPPPPSRDRRESWTANRPQSSHTPQSNGHGPQSNGHGPPRMVHPYPPHHDPNGPPPGWYPPYERDPRDVRHHPYRPPSGPRTAPLVERERMAGWEQGPPPGASVPPHPPHSAPHEPRQPPSFEGYALHPHPGAQWPQHRREYAYPPDYPRRSASPPPQAVRLAPLRRE